MLELRHRTGRKARLATASLLALIAACGGAEPSRTAGDGAVPADSSISSDSPSSRPGRATTSAPDPTATPGAGNDRQAADTIRRITARLSEYHIELSADSLANGRVALLLVNDGVRPHTIEVRDQRSMRWRGLAIAPGSRSTMTIPMQPGRYDIESAEPAYVVRGMHAVLVVR